MDWGALGSATPQPTPKTAEGFAERRAGVREEKLPFPNGTILAKLAWKQVPSVGDDGALGRMRAFVPGRATTIQIMVQDSKKYASTGGRWFGRFMDGKPVDEAQHKTCFPVTRPTRKGTTWSLRVTRLKRPFY